jgi:hypothetical protein
MKSTKPRDKQLGKLELNEALRRRRLDQALNIKLFALAAGISYSLARDLFRQPGFPAVCGVVFWSDFVEWRHARTGLTALKESASRTARPDDRPQPQTHSSLLKDLPPKAARILAECG